MKRRRNHHQRHLSIQSLEQRRLFAADVGLADGFLSIIGSELDDVVEAYADQSQVVVHITQKDSAGDVVSEQTESFDAAQVQGLYFEGGEGNDVFVNDTNLRAIVRGGGGDDVLLGGSGGDILSGGDADDVLSSGGGNDALLGGGGQNVTLGGPLSSEPDAATAPMAGDPVQPADAELASSTDTTDAELQDPPVEQLTPAGQVDEEATAMETPAAAEASQELETDTAQEGDGNSSGVDPSTDDTTADSDSSTPCHLPSAVSANESAVHHAHEPRLGAPRWVASAAFRRWTPTPVALHFVVAAPTGNVISVDATPIAEVAATDSLDSELAESPVADVTPVSQTAADATPAAEVAASDSLELQQTELPVTDVLQVTVTAADATPTAEAVATEPVELVQAELPVTDVLQVTVTGSNAAPTAEAVATDSAESEQAESPVADVIQVSVTAADATPTAEAAATDSVESEQADPPVAVVIPVSETAADATPAAEVSAADSVESEEADPPVAAATPVSETATDVTPAAEVAATDSADQSDDAHDVLFGGPGNDWLFGGEGDDWLFGDDSGQLDPDLLLSLMAAR